MSIDVLQGPGKEVGRDRVYSALPRPFAWVLAFEHPVGWLGAAVGLGHLLVAGAVLIVVGRPTGLTWGDVFAHNITYTLYFAGVPIAIAVLVRGLERDARDLAPVLGAEQDGGASFYREALTVAPCAAWLGVAVGLLVAVTTLWFIGERVGEMGPVGALFLSLREIAIDFALFGVMGWAVGAAMRLSQLTQDRARVDLLEPRPFAALARNGTRLAAVWLVLMALSVAVMLAPPEGFAEISRSLSVLMLLLASFAIVALVLPCRGARRALRSAKRADLEEVRGQIAEARRSREDSRLPGLLAWEARVEGLSEWPIDATALRRTGLFLLLPLASWVGSAFVERWVDSAVG